MLSYLGNGVSTILTYNKIREKFNSEKGFTLIELMATIAILALIVVIAVPAIGNIMQNAENDSMVAEIEMVEKAAGLAYFEQGPAGAAESYTIANLSTMGLLDIEPDSPLMSGVPSPSVQRVSGKEGAYAINVTTLPAEYKAAWNNR